MNWIPVGLGLLKLGVLGVTIFYAIKSHRDGEVEQQRERAEAEAGVSEPD